MSLQDQVNSGIKQAIKAKNKVVLETLRAIKSALLLKQSEGKDKQITKSDEIKLLQKLHKQRNESAFIYRQQNRLDLMEEEQREAEVIAQFLPKQMSESDIEAEVKQTIQKLNATSMKDMGKVMGVISQKLAGKADGKILSGIVRGLLK